MGLRVYVAGPISKGNTVLNIRKAIEVAERIRRRGHYPFVPHLTTFHWYFLYIDSLSLDNSGWHGYNLAFLKVCDVLVRLPGESTGSDMEVDYAKSLDIPVYEGLEAFMNSIHWGVENKEENGTPEGI